MAAESAQPPGATEGRADRHEHGGTGAAGAKPSVVTGSAWLSGRTRRGAAWRPVRHRTPFGRRAVEWLGRAGGDVAGGVLYGIARHYVVAGAILFFGSVFFPKPFGVWITLWGGILYAVAIGYAVGRIWARLDRGRGPGTHGVAGGGELLPSNVSGAPAAAAVDPLRDLLWGDADYDPYLCEEPCGCEEFGQRCCNCSEIHGVAS